MPSKLFSVLIFDLDDTLVDTSKYLVPKATSEACKTLINTGLNTNFKNCIHEKNNFSSLNLRLNFFDYIVNKYGLHKDSKLTEQKLIDLGKNAFYNRPIIEPLKPFKGVTCFLKQKSSEYKLYLVSQGEKKTQLEKIKLLNIKKYFHRVYISNINSKSSKKDIFLKILKENPFPPEKFLCIGNRLDKEIKDANQCQMKTCYIQHGEYKKFKPKSNLEHPDFIIKNFQDLERTCQL